MIRQRIPQTVDPATENARVAEVLRRTVELTVDVNLITSSRSQMLATRNFGDWHTGMKVYNVERGPVPLALIPCDAITPAFGERIYDFCTCGNRNKYN